MSDDDEKWLIGLISFDSFHRFNILAGTNKYTHSSQVWCMEKFTFLGASWFIKWWFGMGNFNKLLQELVLAKFGWLENSEIIFFAVLGFKRFELFVFVSWGVIYFFRLQSVKENNSMDFFLSPGIFKTSFVNWIFFKLMCTKTKELWKIPTIDKTKIDFAQKLRLFEQINVKISK